MNNDWTVKQQQLQTWWLGVPIRPSQSTSAACHWANRATVKWHIAHTTCCARTNTHSPSSHAVLPWEAEGKGAGSDSARSLASYSIIKYCRKYEVWSIMLLHVALMLIGYLTDTMTTDSHFWGSQKKNTVYHAQVQDKWITDGFIDFELNYLRGR